MDHVNIGLQIITLIAGAGIMIYTYQVYKSYRYPYLSHLCCFFMFFNLYLFSSTVSHYLLINYFDNLQLFKSSGFFKVSEPLASLFYVGRVYFLIALFSSYQNKQPIKWLLHLLTSCALYIIIIVLLNFSLVLPSAITNVLGFIYSGIYFFVFLLFFVVLYSFAFSTIRQKNKNEASKWMLFSMFYCIGYTALFFSSMFARSNHRIISITIYLTFNIFPFFWYRFFLLKNSRALTFAVAEAEVNTVFGKFGVSERQSEIIELIIKGKSNREIADILYIAPHTVKNHIYNVYQKLGIKSRFELVNFFLEQNKRRI